MRNDFLFFVVLGCGNFLLLAVLDRWLEWREQRRVHITRIGPPDYRRWRRKVWKKRVTFGSLRRFLKQKKWSIDRRRREREMAQWTDPPPWVERIRLKGKRR